MLIKMVDGGSASGDTQQLSAPVPASFKMSTVHEILCKRSLEGDQSTPPNAYGSVKPHTNFDANWDALKIETPIRTKGVHEVTIINILSNCSNEQRLDIAFAYQRTKKELASALTSALSGHLERVILGLLKTLPQYDTSELKGLGTDKDPLIEIICSRANQELQKINRTYKEMYEAGLEDIISNTSGDFRKLMVALAEVEVGSVIDYELIDQDAWDLYGAGMKRKGTDVPGAFPSGS